LSAAAFAREHGIRYNTLCGWRHRLATTQPSPAFVQVELPKPTAPVGKEINRRQVTPAAAHCHASTF
jgi:hypothetical protein